MFWAVLSPFILFFGCNLFRSQSDQPASSADTSPANSIAAPDIFAPTPSDQARWQKCAGLAQTIMDKTGAQYERTSDIEHNVFLKHRSVHELMMTCSPYQSLGTSGGWDKGAYPPDNFYSTLAIATAVVTGDSPAVLVGALRACHGSALKPASDEMAEANTAKTHIECQAFTRDGGGVSISAWAR